MPAGITYAKGLQNISTSVSNGFLIFSFEIVDNYNTDTSTGDSTTLYSYYFPTNAVSLKFISNLTVGSNELFEISCQNEQVSFANQEYFDIQNGVMADISGIYSLIIGALNL